MEVFQYKVFLEVKCWNNWISTSDGKRNVLNQKTHLSVPDERTELKDTWIDEKTTK